MRVDHQDIYETTPTFPERLHGYHHPSWYEVASNDGKWVYVMRKNKRGDEFTVYRYPTKAEAK